MKAKGFTLMEMIVVIGILAVLASIAIPGFTKWMPNIKLRSALQDMYLSLNFARTTAIKKNCQVCFVFNQPIMGTNSLFTIFKDKNRNFIYESGLDEILAVRSYGDFENITYNYAGEVIDGIIYPGFYKNDQGLFAIACRGNGLVFPPYIPEDEIFTGCNVMLINKKGKIGRVFISVTGNITIK